MTQATGVSSTVDGTTFTSDSVSIVSVVEEDGSSGSSSVRNYVTPSSVAPS